MGITVHNMEQAEAWEATGGAMLPAGKHLVTIDEASEGTTKNGYDEIELSLSNDQGSIRAWVTCIQRTYGKVVQLLNATGVAVPSGPGATLESSVLVGRKLVIVIEERPSLKGGTRSEVTQFLPPTTDIPVASPASAPAPAAAVSDVPF